MSSNPVRNRRPLTNHANSPTNDHQTNHTLSPLPKKQSHHPSHSQSSTEDAAPYVYRRYNPTYLLTAFFVTFLILLVCLWQIYSLMQLRSAERKLTEAEGSIQLLHSRQIELNAGTQEKWDLYQEHRGNVTQTLLRVLENSKFHQPDMCILGAGNLNDILLRSLLPNANDGLLSSNDGTPDSVSSSSPLPSFGTISLVDLDANSMRLGLDRQVTRHGFTGSNRIRMYSSDITGEYETLNEWKRLRVRHDAFDTSPSSSASYATLHQTGGGLTPKKQPFPSETILKEWIEKMRKELSPTTIKRSKGLPQHNEAGELIQYPVVASICILSQLIDMYMSVVDEHHPSFLDGVLTLRDHHLSLLLNMIQPGGWGILITDIVSSLTAPELLNTSSTDLPHLLPRLIDGSNFFTGCNPHAIVSKLSNQFRSFIQPNSLTLYQQPWHWTIGAGGDGHHKKQFLVYAIVFQKKKE